MINKKISANISEGFRVENCFLSAFLAARNMDMLYMLLTNVLEGEGWFFT